MLKGVQLMAPSIRICFTTAQDSATDLSLERCTFRNNTAEQSGGALGASSIRDANLTELAFTANIVSGGVAP